MNYIDLLHIHYTLHFDLFQDLTTLQDWLDLMFRDANADNLEKAKRHLGAMVLNMVSGKVGQYNAVTEDNRTAGDVVTFVSLAVTDNDLSNDIRAKKTGKRFNGRKNIPAGWVPVGNILYKGGEVPGIDWSFATPQEFVLHQNYPNPFNPSTTISFSIPEGPVTVKLAIYDVMGRSVKSLVSEEMSAGQYSFVWDGTNDFSRQVASGMYFYQIVAGNFVETRKMILMR